MSNEYGFTGLRLLKEHIDKLNAIAAKKRVSRNAVIVWAIDAYLDSLFLPDRPSHETSDQQENQPTEQAA